MRPTLTRRLALTLAAGLGVAALAACGGGGSGGGSAPASAQGDMSLGSAQARVTVIEYASASCSHCARWNRDVFPEFRRRYIDTNRVHYVFREFLTPPQSLAASGFLLARCAAANGGGSDRYFNVLDAVFRGQEEIFRTQQTRPVLLRIAQSAGLNESQFNACLRNETALNALNDRVERATREDNIESTPTFVVNGRHLVGEQTMAQLAAAIDPLLGSGAPPALSGSAAATGPASGGSTPAAGATANSTPAGAASGSASATAATAPTPAGPVTATTAATSGSPAN